MSTIAVPGGTLPLTFQNITALAWPRGGLPSFDNNGELDITRNLGLTPCQFHFQNDTLSLRITPPSGTKWAPAGSDFNDYRQDLIDGIATAPAHANGFDDLIRPSIAVSSVTRTNDTQVNITLPTSGSYVPTYPGERFYCTIPHNILRTTGGAAVPTSETFGCNRRDTITGEFPDPPSATVDDPMILFGRPVPMVACSFADFAFNSSILDCSGSTVSITAPWARVRFSVMVDGHNNSSKIPNPFQVLPPNDEEPYVRETGTIIYRPATELAAFSLPDGCTAGFSASTSSCRFTVESNGWYVASDTSNQNLFGTDVTWKRWQLVREFDTDYSEDFDHDGWAGSGVEVSTPSNGGGIYVNEHPDTLLTDPILSFQEI